jgi:ankyrin repeat protein
MYSDTELLELFQRKDLIGLAAAIDSGLDLNRKVEGATLLSIASDCGGIELVRLLLESGASAKLGNDDGSNALTIADAAVIPELLNFGVSLMGEMSAPRCSLHYGALLGDCFKLRVLLDSDPRALEECIYWLDEDGMTPLANAVEFEQPIAVDYLLSLGVDPNDRGRSDADKRPLAIATRRGLTAIVAKLEAASEGKSL